MINKADNENIHIFDQEHREESKMTKGHRKRVKEDSDGENVLNNSVYCFIGKGSVLKTDYFLFIPSYYCTNSLNGVLNKFLLQNYLEMASNINFYYFPANPILNKYNRSVFICSLLCKNLLI